jgi:phage gp29-like protein
MGEGKAMAKKKQAAPAPTQAREYERPPAIPAKELPLFGTTDFDRVSKVRRALAGLESGLFTDAAALVDAMGRDDRIEAVVQQRMEALGGLPFELQPAVGMGTAGDEVAATALELAPVMLDEAALSELRTWALWLGFGLAQKVWDTSQPVWVARLKVWHPRFVRFDWTTRTFRVLTEGGEVEVLAGSPEWLLYAPFGTERPWMRGLVRSLAIPFLVRQFCLRDWSRYSEVHGLPVKKAIVPAKADPKAQERFRNEVAALGAESTIFMPRMKNGTTEEVFDMELVEAVGRSEEGFDKLIARCDSAIAIRVLGQNLTTEVKEGSRAAASVHERVAQRKLASDATTLTACLREQLFKPWAAYNFGNAELAPWPVWDATPPEDKAARATTYKELGEGIQALQKTGMDVDVDAEAERFGVAVRGPAKPPPQRAPPEDPDAEVEEPGDEEPEKLSRGPRALLASPKQRGQDYLDRLERNTVAQAAEALAGDLEAVLGAIDGAESPEALREKLAALYEGMKPDALTGLTRRAWLLAELAGQTAIREEVS